MDNYALDINKEDIPTYIGYAVMLRIILKIIF